MGLVGSPIGTNIAWVSQPQRSDRFSALLANSRLSRFTSCPLSGPVDGEHPHSGWRRRLDAFTSGMPFGELAFLDRSPRSADVTALGAVECHVLTRDAFAQLDREAPMIKIRLLENLALGLTGMLRQANRELAVLK